MERFVFVAAITGALLFGAFQIFGSPHMNITIDGDFDAGGSDDVVEVAPGRYDSHSFGATEIEVENAALILTITPEDRTDVAIEIDNPGHAPMPDVRLDGDTLIIDGQLRGRLGNCGTDTIELRGYGDIARTDLPRVIIRAPRTLNLDINGASSTEIGPSQALEASFTGCGGAQIGDVAGLLDLDLAGSGDFKAGAANQLQVDMAGSGSLEAGAITQSANADIAGAGEIILASLTGALEVDSAGSGNVEVRGGAVTDANIDLAGSGDVSIAAPVQTLAVSIVGSGDVDVTAVVGSINADIAGSGSVSAPSVTGQVTKETWGSGDVRIGG